MTKTEDGYDELERWYADALRTVANEI